MPFKQRRNTIELRKFNVTCLGSTNSCRVRDALCQVRQSWRHVLLEGVNRRALVHLTPLEHGFRRGETVLKLPPFEATLEKSLLCGNMQAGRQMQKIFGRDKERPTEIKKRAILPRKPIESTKNDRILKSLIITQHNKRRHLRARTRMNNAWLVIGVFFTERSPPFPINFHCVILA